MKLCIIVFFLILIFFILILGYFYCSSRIMSRLISEGTLTTWFEGSFWILTLLWFVDSSDDRIGKFIFRSVSYCWLWWRLCNGPNFNFPLIDCGVPPSNRKYSTGNFSGLSLFWGDRFGWWSGGNFLDEPFLTISNDYYLATSSVLFSLVANCLKNGSSRFRDCMNPPPFSIYATRSFICETVLPRIYFSY